MSMRLWKARRSRFGAASTASAVTAFITAVVLAAQAAPALGTAGAAPAGTTATQSPGLTPSQSSGGPVSPARAHLQAAPRLPGGAQAVGPVPATDRLTLSVLVPPRDPAGLAALAAAVSQPGGRRRAHYLTASQFAERFGADQSNLDALAARLRSRGLDVVGEPSNRLSLTVEAPALTAEKEFGVSLRQERIKGRTFFSNTSAAVVPQGASAVLGLDDLALADPASEAAPGPRDATSSCPTSGSGPAYIPSQIAQAYGLDAMYGSGLTGAGQTIASFELADYSDSDVASYTTCFGGTAADVSRVLTDGGAAIGSGTSEATADVENLLGLAPDLHILVYEAPDSAQGIFDNYAAIISQDRAQVLATSWGQCEQLTPAAMEEGENTLFQEAAVQGQTVVAASGDSGSEDCYQAGFYPDPELAVDDPASQPYVTGIGGTSLLSVSPRDETVWNASGGAGGGGVSHQWAMPSYQRNVVGPLSSGAPCGAGAGSCREVPDVSGSADANHGYYFYCQAGDCAGSGWSSVGGTSLASPVWGAVVALANQSCGTGPVGFLNPTLYLAGGGATATGATNDIVSGNNDLLGRYGLYPAGPGYDMASGLGTPNAPVLAAELCSSAAIRSTGTPGYRLVASDGGIFDYGSAAFFGSTGAERLNRPIVGMAATPDGRGYWLVAADGGIFTFGDAGFHGSGSGRLGRSRVVGMAADDSTGGYWLATNAGSLLAFDAPTLGAASGVTAPVVGVAASPDDAGVRLVGSDGNVYPLGDATDLGNLVGTALARPVVGISSTTDGAGYWLVASDGGMFSFGDAAFLGSAGAIRLVRPIVGLTTSG